VRLHREARPFLELLVHALARREGLEPERMAAEVRERLAARVKWQGKARAKGGERIARVARLCARQCMRRAHQVRPLTAYSSGRLGTASPPSAGT